MKNKAIFFDRDGVINECFPNSNIRNLKIIEKTKKLIEYLYKNNWLIIVITNQPDVSRGKQTKEKIDQENYYILNQIPEISEIFTCYHSDEDNCSCRKPKYGLFLTAENKYNIDLFKSWMIGDRQTDMIAGKSVGCKTIFIDYGLYEERPLSTDYVITDISIAKEIII